MTRRGFTLVELLVATAVFVIGFAAVFSLFLSGMRFRKLADDTTLTATLAASVLTEIYLDSSATAVAGGPVAPSEYSGDGQAPLVAATEAPSGMATKMFAYPAIPGAFYRVDNCTDLLNGQDPFTTAINADMLTLCPGAKVDDYSDLNRRLRLLTTAQASTATAGTDFEDQLVQHGVALRYKAVLIRQPHWLFK